MPYTKNDPAWQEGGAPGISAARLNHMETQYDESAADLDGHKAAATLDHPDGSVADAKIGGRTANPVQAPTGNGPGTLTQWFSWLANRIKAITGATNWWDAPAATIATLWGKFAPTDGHTHDGTAGNGPTTTMVGTWSDTTTSIPAASTHAADIDLGKAHRGALLLTAGFGTRGGATVACTTVPADAVAFATDGGYYQNVHSYGLDGRLSAVSQFGGQISLQQAYCTGNYLRLVFYNEDGSSARTLSVRALTYIAFT